MPTYTPLPLTPSSSHHWKKPGWELWAWSPGPGVLGSIVRGTADVECVRTLIGCFEELGAETGHVDAFHDWEGVESYESEARALYTDWSRERRKRISGAVHILMRSKLVAMGVAVANIVLANKLTAYTSRRTFEATRSRFCETPLQVRIDSERSNNVSVLV